MIEVRNTIIEKLYNHLGIPVITNNNVKNRPDYPFVDYNILTLINFNGEGNIEYEYLEDDITNSLHLQPKVSISFNAYSRDEIEAYNTAKVISDYLKHIGYEELSNAGVVVVDVMEISNRTVLEVDEYEFRYGLDVIFRFKDRIDRIDREIKTYSIEEEE